MPAHAQDYPNRPIKVIIPNPPGGPGDIIARAFTEKATPNIGKPFVLRVSVRRQHDNWYGICGKSRARRLYDPWLFPLRGSERLLSRSSFSYNIETDFSPIAGIGSVPLVLVVRAGLNINDMTEFSAAIRKGS